MASTKRHLSLRVDPDDLAVIDQHAHRLRLDRTTYLIRAGRQELHEPTRLEDLEDRVQRVEHLINLGGT